MFEDAFKNIDNPLRTYAGCQNELDYIEQTLVIEVKVTTADEPPDAQLSAPPAWAE